MPQNAPPQQSTRNTRRMSSSEFSNSAATKHHPGDHDELQQPAVRARSLSHRHRAAVDQHVGEKGRQPEQAERPANRIRCRSGLWSPASVAARKVAKANMPIRAAG